MLCSTTTRYSTVLDSSPPITAPSESTRRSCLTQPPLQPAKNYRSGEVSTRRQYRAQPAADGGTDASGNGGGGEGGGVPRRVHAALRQDQESNNDQRKL